MHDHMFISIFPSPKLKKQMIGGRRPITCKTIHFGRF